MWGGTAFNETGHDSLKELTATGNTGADVSKSSQHKTVDKNNSHNPSDNEVVFYYTYKNTLFFFFFFSEIINRWLYYAQKQMGTNYLVLTLDIKN